MTARAMRVAADYSPREFGVMAAALNANTNSNAVAIDGCNQVTLHGLITNATGAALTVTAFLQYRRKGDTVWAAMPSSQIIAGVETLSARQLVFPATAAAVAIYAITYPLPIDGLDGYEFRLATITAAGAGATDLLNMRCTVGHSGA